MTPPRATDLATPVDLRRHRNVTPDELASRFHPGYRGAIQRLPTGRRVYRGLPFQFARATAARVASPIRGSSLSARDAVASDVPAIRATSARTTRRSGVRRIRLV